MLTIGCSTALRRAARSTTAAAAASAHCTRALSATAAAAEPPKDTAAAGAATPMNSFWMPFTANQAFKQSPRMLTKSKGMYYWTADGRKILDGTAGLWWVGGCWGRGSGVTDWGQLIDRSIDRDRLIGHQLRPRPCVGFA